MPEHMREWAWKYLHIYLVVISVKFVYDWYSIAGFYHELGLEYPPGEMLVSFLWFGAQLGFFWAIRTMLKDLDEEIDESVTYSKKYCPECEKSTTFQGNVCQECQMHP